MEEGDTDSSRGLSALESSVSGLSGLANAPVMALEQAGADSMGGSAGGGASSAAPQSSVNETNGGIGPTRGNDTVRGNDTGRGNRADRGIGNAANDGDDGTGTQGGNEVMDAAPHITSGVPFDGLNEEELPECEGCNPPSWILIGKEVRYRYLMMLECGITTPIVLCSRPQDPIPWSNLDIDGLIIEGPIDMLDSGCGGLLSPMAIDLCHYTRQPDWQRGDGNWTCLVTGTCDSNTAGTY